MRYIPIFIALFLLMAPSFARYRLERKESWSLPTLHNPSLLMDKDRLIIADPGPGLYYVLQKGDLKKSSLPNGRFTAFFLFQDQLLCLEPGFFIMAMDLENERTKKLISSAPAGDDLVYSLSFGLDEWLYVFNRDTGQLWSYDPDFQQKYSFKVATGGKAARIMGMAQGFGIFDPELGTFLAFSPRGEKRYELGHDFGANQPIGQSSSPSFIKSSGHNPGQYSGQPSGIKGQDNRQESGMDLRLMICAPCLDGSLIGAGGGFYCIWDKNGRPLSGYPKKIPLIRPVSISWDQGIAFILDSAGPTLIRIKGDERPQFQDLSAMLEQGDHLSSVGRGISIVVDSSGKTAIALDYNGALIRRYGLQYFDSFGTYLLKDGLNNSFFGRPGNLAPVLLRGRLEEEGIGQLSLLNQNGRLSGVDIRADESLVYISDKLELVVESPDNSRRIKGNYSRPDPGLSAQLADMVALYGGKYVLLDRYYKKVVLYDSGGRVAWAYETGREPANMGRDIEGNIFLLEKNPPHIAVLGPNGQEKRTFPVAGGISAMGVSELGYIWLIDEKGGLLRLYSERGQEFARFARARNSGEMMAIGAFGNDVAIISRHQSMWRVTRYILLDLMQRASLNYEKKMYAMALQDFQEINSPYESQDLLLGALIYQALGQKEEATELFKKIKEDGLNKEGVLRYGELKVELGL